MLHCHASRFSHKERRTEWLKRQMFRWGDVGSSSGPKEAAITKVKLWPVSNCFCLSLISFIDVGCTFEAKITCDISLYDIACANNIVLTYPPTPCCKGKRAVRSLFQRRHPFEKELNAFFSNVFVCKQKTFLSGSVSKKIIFPKDASLRTLTWNLGTFQNLYLGPLLGTFEPPGSFTCNPFYLETRNFPEPLLGPSWTVECPGSFTWNPYLELGTSEPSGTAPRAPSGPCLAETPDESFQLLGTKGPTFFMSTHRI